MNEGTLPILSLSMIKKILLSFLQVDIIILDYIYDTEFREFANASSGIQQQPTLRQVLEKWKCPETIHGSENNRGPP